MTMSAMENIASDFERSVTGIVRSGATTRITFDTPGTYTYY